MSYQVLARNTDANIPGLVGQAHVATRFPTLLKIKRWRMPILFGAARRRQNDGRPHPGQGAQLRQRTHRHPCNACDSCLRIAQGQEMVDVLEIDAASNRGIEEIRELRENVRYAPARSGKGLHCG